VAWSSGVRNTGIAVIAVMCAAVAGCSASPKPVHKPPSVVIPGVVSGGAAGGTAGVSGRAGSHGIVVLGGWAPGGKQNPVVAGALAYFQWLNAHGGVYGREVQYRVLNDRGDVRFVPSLAHHLVMGDAVFAVFGAAGDQGSPTTRFLSMSGVPDLFSGSGCSCDNAPSRLPEVFGWPLGDIREGKILGAYVAQHYAGQKVDVLYAPDGAGEEELAGFKSAARGVTVAARQPAASTSSAAAAVAAAKRAKAKVVIALTASDVTLAVNSAMTRKGGLSVPLVASSGGTASGLPNGVITDSFLPSVDASAKSAAGSWIALFRKVRDKYLHSESLSPSLIDGMAEAYEMAAAMFRAGPGAALTRQSLVSALNGMTSGPAVAPVAYSPADHGGEEGAYVGEISSGVLSPMTGVMVTGARTTGSVTPSPSRQQMAPADGIPPH
jgi:branched-chain amino acid transport system substrate-binding protein